MIESGAASRDAKPCPARYHIPRSTYRLQLNDRFTFHDALEIAEYLHELGISDCYASPIFTARPGSSHGYDVCNWTELSTALGGKEGFDHWAECLRRFGMGLLLDVVPNHMGTDPANPWWRDVLERGVQSKYANWFDINWRPATPELQGRVLVPILQNHYWKLLEAGEIQITCESGAFGVVYQGNRFPLSPESRSCLEAGLMKASRVNNTAKGSAEARSQLGELLTRLGNSEARKINGEPPLREWMEAAPETRRELDEALKVFNGTVGAPTSFDPLAALLQEQHYRLGYWRLAGEEINYRRFFDVNDLVSLCIERPETFAATHELLFNLLREGKVTGLRIDHPDGLWDPGQYLRRLQEGYAKARGGWPGNHNGPLYIVVEKILSREEDLPADWPVAGTTGYEFLNLVNGLFIDGTNRVAFDQIYAEFTGSPLDVNAVVYQNKQKILQTSMRSDLHNLGLLLRSIAAQTRYGLDFSLRELEHALVEVIAGFPVYRTYMSEESEASSPQERRFIQRAMERVRSRKEKPNAAVLDFIEKLLLLDAPADLDEAGRQSCRRFVMKFQQLTGSVMAKGYEDTSFYTFNRFISLNEVGGSLEGFGTHLAEFHEQNKARAECWPHSLLATATHDTKRGEDLRVRLNVLSEMPEAWCQAVMKWSQFNQGKKSLVNGRAAPDANDEYFLYQTLVGAWLPDAQRSSGLEIFRRRIVQYTLKVLREAKANTSWTEPNLEYEDASKRFVEELLTPGPANPFLDDFMLFHQKVAFFGMLNSLTQLVVKLTSPGVPDFYQGSELWDYSLVDPDNRQAVDYKSRRCLLSDLRERFPRDPREMASLVRGLLKTHQTGQIKLYVMWRLLQFRREHRRLFDEGGYTPIFASGLKHDHVCAFGRASAAGTVITVAARLIHGLAKGAERAALDPEVWQDAVLPLPNSQPRDRYRDVLSEQIIVSREDGSGLALKEVLGLLPAAVLEKLE